jgi:hypothetical protein
MRKALNWKRSRIFMLEVEAGPQSCIADLSEYCFVYEEFVASGRFELRPCNQYMLLWVIRNGDRLCGLVVRVPGC